MNRRGAGWLLLCASPGCGATTLILLAAAAESVFGRTPVWAAGLIVAVNFGVAAFGTAAGGYLLARRPDRNPLPVAAAGVAGAAVFMACVFVAEKILKWL